MIMKQLNTKWKGRLPARLNTNWYLFFSWASTTEIYSNALEVGVFKTLGQIHLTCNSIDSVRLYQE